MEYRHILYTYEGRVYVSLYAVIDIHSRFIVGWRLNNTLSANNCYELIEDCIRVYGAPEIINSDQGVQYTTKRWEDLLYNNHIQISMDGRGRCKDNIWIERFGAPSNRNTSISILPRTLKNYEKALTTLLSSTTIKGRTKVWKSCYLAWNTILSCKKDKNI